MERLFEFLAGHSTWAYGAGDIAFARGWPLWLLYLLLGVAAAAIAGTLLRRRELVWWRAAVIGSLQLAFVALLLVMLWRPVLNVETIRERQNVVAVMVDTSGSMQDGEQSQRLKSALAALSPSLLESLRDVAQLRLFGFSDRAAAVDDLAKLPAGASQSHLGDSLRTVLQTAGGAPLAAVVLLSDGAENGGGLGEERLHELAALGIPVHTVGFGDEQAGNDLELTQLDVASEAGAGEIVKAEVSIRHQQQPWARLRVYDGGKLLAVQDVKLSRSAGVTTQGIEFPAGDAGLRDLRFAIDAVPGESNTQNNSRNRLLDVAGERRSVLYVEGEPRWEYKFIRRAVEGDKSLRLASLVRATPNRYYRQGLQSAAELPDGFPKTREELFAYDAVIIGSLEAAALSTAQHQALKDFVDLRGGSVLLLAGRDGLAAGGWGRVPIADALPAKLGGAAASYGAAVTKATLTVYGSESPLGRLDTDAERNRKAWESLPTLTDFQQLGELRPGALVLLDAVSGETRRPLLVTQRFGRGNTYLLATGSTWRWKMRLPHDDDRHGIFWRQLLHQLAIGAARPATLTTETRVFDDETQVPVTAELHDAQFKPINDAVVTVRAMAESGAVVEQKLVASGRGDGRYTATLEAQAPGLYRLEMNAQRAGKPVGTATTHIRRQDGVLESFDALQHRSLLERIARETGARYWKPAELAQLPDAIRYSRAGMIERQTLDLWNIPALLLLALLLKGGEWLLRRHWRRL